VAWAGATGDVLAAMLARKATTFETLSGTGVRQAWPKVSVPQAFGVPGPASEGTTEEMPGMTIEVGAPEKPMARAVLLRIAVSRRTAAVSTEPQVFMASMPPCQSWIWSARMRELTSMASLALSEPPIAADRVCSSVKLAVCVP